jgi:hypothetical protein
MLALTMFAASAASAASVTVQPAAESAAAVTIVRPALDPKTSLPVGPAKVCIPVANARPCYTPPSSESWGLPERSRPPFGLHPKAVDVTLARGTKAVVFTATASAGGSGALTIVALLVPKNGRLVDLLPASCTLSELSQYQFWNAPAISKMALFVTANFVWGNGEPHFGVAHHYRVSIYTFDPQKGMYVLRTQYVSAAKYGNGQKFGAPPDLLQREQPSIIAKLR